MAATLIDGKAMAAALCARVAEEAASFAMRTNRRPGLAVVLVGDDPASHIYVRSKVRQTRLAGMRSFEYRLPAAAEEAELLTLIAGLNAADAVDGILVQLPLPAHMDRRRVLEAIDPAKDVDGFHPVNVGRLTIGDEALVPCTPQGCLMLLHTVLPDLTGVEAAVIGCSNIVGKPMAQLLLASKATVTMAHVHTRDVAAVCRRAELLVIAVGRPGLIRGDWIRPGAAVIDVGINRVAGTAPDQPRLVGDVVFEEARQVAGAITPVPGGVGPMTIACLLRNTLIAARRRAAWRIVPRKLSMSEIIFHHS